ncbi:MAG: TIGR02391 family protein [Caldilineaceae bacterium]|nr:TIGR02391 family protein [Caldilineaceae bacterium]
MNLQTQIDAELWRAISETYEAQNYSHAIVDAIHCLSNILREKTGLDGDGASLAGAALGGNTPLLKLNRFQTESEKSEQKGLESILRGIYQGIRNPRSHELVRDDKANDCISICFIDYLLRTINQSQPSFTIQNFADSVYERHFVSSQRYADLLVEGIPKNKLLDAMIEIFRRKTEGGNHNLPYVSAAIRTCMSEDQLTDFLNVVSEEMLKSQVQDEIRATLQILIPELWTRIKETPRLRIENMLIEAVGRGTDDGFGFIDEESAFATWACDYLPHFSLKVQAVNILIGRITSSSDSFRYILKYFGSVLPAVCENDHLRDFCIAAIVEAVRKDCKIDPNHEFLKLTNKYLWASEDWREKIRLGVDGFHANDNSDEDIPF